MSEYQESKKLLNLKKKSINVIYHSNRLKRKTITIIVNAEQLWG
jgi:hypothetical protein